MGIIARQTKSYFVEYLVVSARLADVRKVIRGAQERLGKSIQTIFNNRDGGLADDLVC